MISSPKFLSTYGLYTHTTCTTRDRVARKKVEWVRGSREVVMQKKLQVLRLQNKELLINVENFIRWHLVCVCGNSVVSSVTVATTSPDVRYMNVWTSILYVWDTLMCCLSMDAPEEQPTQLRPIQSRQITPILVSRCPITAVNMVI